MQVSIVVPTYNRSALVARLLRSFDATTYGDDYEVVVVDDGSTDDTEDIVQSTKPTVGYQLRYVKQDNAALPLHATQASQHPAEVYWPS